MLSYKKLFLALFIIGVLVRLFVAITLPDSVLSDSLYHLAIAEHIAETGFLPFEGIELLRVSTVPPPMFHIFVASVAIISGLAVSQIALPLTLLVSAIQLAAILILLKKLFPKNWVYGGVFFTVMPLLTKYAGVSYVETFSSILVVASVYFFVSFHKTKQKKFLLFSALPLSAMAISKLNATILLPVFILFFALGAREKKLRSWIPLFIVVTLLFSGSWFVFEFFRTGELFSSNAGDVQQLVDYPQWVAGSNPVFGAVGFVYEFNKGFWAFPPDNVFSNAQVKQMLPLIEAIGPAGLAALLSLITIPLTFFLAFAILRSAKNKEPYSLMLLLLYAFAFIIVIARSKQYVSARMILPVMPLLSISFVQGIKTISANWRKAVLALVVVVAAYSFLNMVFFAGYYQLSFQKSAGLYDSISSLPEGSKIVLSGNHFRAVRWIAKRESIGPEEIFRIPKGEEPGPFVRGLSAQEIYLGITQSKVSHLALTCVDDPWDRAVIGEMEQQGLLEQVFIQDCAVLYTVN